MINKKWLTEVGYEVGFQIVQPQLPVLPQTSNAGQITLSPNPANFTATVPGGITNQLSTITVQARDSSGQSSTIGGNTVFVVVTGSNSAAGPATDNGNGTYTFTYTPTIAGQDSIAITADSITISGSPYPSQIISATSITKQQIITYLQSLPGRASNKVLSATFLATYQHNVAPWTEGTGYGQIMDPPNFLHTLTGKFPAMIGQDWHIEDSNPNYTTVTDANSFAINYWNAGGLNLAHYLWDNPWTGGSKSDLTVTTTFHDVVTPGTAASTTFMAQVSALTDKFALLQANGVVVIFRPFPEVNGNWFWWGGGAAGRTAADIILLFQQVHDYMQVTRGLTNIIWVYNVNAGVGNYTTYYPGANYVDIASFDYYGDNNGSGGSTYDLTTFGVPVYTALAGLSPSKILAMSETGPYVSMNISSPNSFDYTTVITTIRASLPNIAYYMVWDGLDRYDVQNNANGVMIDSWIVDRSEISLAVSTPVLVFSTEPSGTPTAGQPFAINPVIQLQDGAGHNVAVSGIQIILTSSSPNIALAVTPSPLVTDSTGKATVTSIVPTGTVGTYMMTAAATGYASAVSTSFTVFPGTINPAHCTAAIVGSTQGQPITITVQAKDTWDNSLTSGGATVVVNITGANTATPVVTDNGNGTYSASYIPANIGTNTITITANGTAISGSPFTLTVSAPTTLYPNLPAGLTRLAESSFDIIPTSAGGTGQFIYSGGSWSLTGNWGPGTGWELKTDSTAPQSPPNVIQYLWYTGLTGGAGTGHIWNANWLNGHGPVDELYVAYRFKIPTIDFENQLVGTKLLGYISYGYDPSVRVNEANLRMDGNGGTISSGPFKWAAFFMGAFKSVNTLNSAYIYSPNPIAWHLMEVHYKINRSTLHADWTDIYLDGTLIMSSHTQDLLLRDSGMTWGTDPTYPFPPTLGFYQVHFDPIWGGTGGTKTRNDYLWIDHLYVAGK